MPALRRRPRLHFTVREGWLNDPHGVLWADHRYHLVLGARLAGGHPALLQYSSDDLRDWRYDGVAAEDPSVRAMWECPQLFPLDGTWVLLVSADDDVAYALGDYDGRRFTPQTWGSFGNHGPAYATTTFVDRDGRRCAMSWIRETGPADGWSGALSLPWVLRVEGDLLVADRHPHLAGHDGDPCEAPVDARALVADADIVEMTRKGVAGVITIRRPS